MPINLASPGIQIREVDLTIGRVNSATDKTAALVAPFEKGPVNIPITIENEQDLIDNFGQPYGNDADNQVETWMVGSSYLAYGGRLSVVRAEVNDGCNAGTSGTITINSVEDYINKGYDDDTVADKVFVGRNPGSWANGLKVAIIDGFADQVVAIGTDSSFTDDIKVGFGITQAVPANTILPGAGSTSELKGYFKGIITGIGTAAGIGSTEIAVKLVSHVDENEVETKKDYEASGIYQFTGLSTVTVYNNSGTGIGTTTFGSTATDWFNAQTITLNDGSTLNWDQIADRPGTSSYASLRNSRFDEVHVVVIDDKGKVTGNAGTILEKHLNLSKAKDAEFSVGSPSYWRKYLLNASNNIFALGGPAGVTTTGFKSSGEGFAKQDDINWDQNADGITFGANGNVAIGMTGGLDYNGAAGIGSTTDKGGSLQASLSSLSSGYDLFANKEEYDVDFILMGSSAGLTEDETKALANKAISVAELRKDAIAFVSPHKNTFITNAGKDTVDVKSSSDITDEVIEFYAPITSSTYAVFDSGYKYMFDRFSNSFRYVPLNGDLAGMCARNDINNFPWFSPAGTARGAVLNAVKLGYNPNQLQRDKLYTNRINPVIFSPGAGIILFGDKTGTGKASAFDRINVRRLFIYLENAIEAAAKDQLFEFNDEITRTNFVNIVEPFLRDVQSKRGIQDFRVVCDETNNTAAVIDNNEFVADIFIKPARSINFIGLTFVATRTGISFEEVIGTV